MKIMQAANSGSVQVLSRSKSPSFQRNVTVKVDSEHSRAFINELADTMSQLSGNWSYTYNKKPLVTEFKINVPPRECSNPEKALGDSVMKYKGKVEAVIENLGLAKKLEDLKEYRKSIEYEI